MHPLGAAPDVFLDDVQRRTFQYFWDTTNPANGLARDRYPTPSFASMAAVGFALTGRLGVDDDGMLELLEPWRGHRQRIIRLIGTSGARKPRHGPRMTIQDHRWH